MPDSGTARCHCGGVEMVATFPSRFCSHCYCWSCRTSHASGVVTWIGFKRDQVQITRGAELESVEPRVPARWLVWIS